jgi:hypothetical protein
MKIDRHNYEECFILYWDNELTLSQKQAVENFIKENSDLQEEFNILGETRFTPDNKIQFEEKGFLLNTSTINITNYEEQLLNYIDDELGNEERKEIERSAEKFPLIQKELLLLQKTKLQPEEVAFPDKSSLYRREERARIISMTWFRVAVAAAIILIAGFTVLQLVNSNNNSTIPPVAKTDEIKTQPVIKPAEPSLTNVVPKSVKKDLPQETVASADNDKIKKNTSLEKKHDLTSGDEADAKKYIAAHQSENNNGLPKEGTRPVEPTSEEYVAEVKILDQQDKTGIASEETGAITAAFSETDVTLKDNPSLYIPGPEKERGGGLKEFLRKTTRVFERRTKIQTTTEDNRLLVGAFAVSLK